jgi:HEPN domain-containing protein
MNPLKLEWVQKAEGDFLTAKREYRARKAPNYDAVCFHAQQTAEKYLKSVLQEKGVNIPRTHSLADLLALLIKLDPAFLQIQPEINVMEGYATQFRYPGLTAEKQEAKDALSGCDRVREFVRGMLGIK